MSATLTWKMSALGAKTGTTGTTFITDLNNLVVAVAGDAAYLWQVASYSIAGNLNYLVLKRKDASAGRILLCFFTSAPAAINTTLSEVVAGSISLSVIHLAYFPAGNVDTPSNITAASGTILGNDTNATVFTSLGTVAAIYTTSMQHFYAESAEGIYFAQQNPAAAAIHYSGAGELFIDAADDVYSGVFGLKACSAFGTAGTDLLNWTTIVPSAGFGTVAMRVHYGVNNRLYFHGLAPVGAIFSTPVGSTDPLTDITTSKAYFFPLYLASQVKGGGFPLKLRQFGYGPMTPGPFAVYSTTGPVTAARNMNAATAGGSYAWLTNFKI